MSSEHLLLLMLIISGSAFFFIALAISSLGTRINPLPATVRNPNNGGNVNSNGELGADHQDDQDYGFSGRLSAESSLIGRSVQAVALISGGLLVFAILELGYGFTVLGYQLGLSGLITAIGAVVLQLVASGLSGYQRNWARAISKPTGAVLRWTSVIPGISHVVDFSLSRGRGDDAVGEDVSATLQESLDFLEESVIPADQNELKMIRGILRMDTVKVRENWNGSVWVWLGLK